MSSSDYPPTAVPSPLTLPTRFISSDLALLIRRPSCTFTLMNLSRLSEWNEAHVHWLLIELVGDQDLTDWALEELARRSLVDGMRLTSMGSRALEEFRRAGFSLPDTRLSPPEPADKGLRQRPRSAPVYGAVSDRWRPSESKREQRPAAMFYSLSRVDLAGVSEAVARLLEQGIDTTSELLRLVDDVGPEPLASESGVAIDLLNTLVSRADLMRVKGVGALYAALLQMIGIESATNLALESPNSVATAARQFNEQVQLTRRPPGPNRIQAWVQHAREIAQLPS